MLLTGTGFAISRRAVSSLDEVRALLSNSYDTVHRIIGPETPFYPGGSVWVWDAQDPTPGGSWHHFEVTPIDPNAAIYLDPAKVERQRHEAEVLLNSFPATERRLEEMGCRSVELLHKPIREAADALLWSCSVFNACSPVPLGWKAGYTDELHPGVRDWPAHVLATAQLLTDGFRSLHVGPLGRVALVPVQEGCAGLYWTEPGSSYDREVQKAAAEDNDLIFHPEHALARAAYHS